MIEQKTAPQLDYRKTAEAILGLLRAERDRQIVAQRFGLGLPKRHTLEKIGNNFGITRERVRQIEKAATARLKASNSPEIARIDQALREHLQQNGQVTPTEEVARDIGASNPSELAYITFLATLAPGIEVIDENDQYNSALAILPDYNRATVHAVAQNLTAALKAHGRPATIDTITAKLPDNHAKPTIENIAKVSKGISQLDDLWGLAIWPEVNPKSIRDKTYVVLSKHGAPLHFSEIAGRIADLGNRRRNVTVQAVHNELIKDPRFVLVGRGIYALAEWGYTPGTVADIITEVLRQESPLHKDEIIKRVLQKRQVKTTTIVLNLQEKDQFVRVSKATYSLK